MLQLGALALYGAIAPFTLAAAGSLPRGVGPEYASYYQNKDHFPCINNAAIRLRLDQVNDNSCDCPDGSDEPGTAACASIDPLSPGQPLPGSTSGTTSSENILPGFWCENKGHIGMYVPFSYVNDGVCDYDLCCDGTEEYQHVNGVKCDNRCAQIGKEYRKLQEEKRSKMERASKQRQTMARQAAELRAGVEARLTELVGEVARLEARRDDLEKAHAQAVIEDQGKVVKGDGEGGKLGVLVGLAKQRVDELRNTLSNIVEQRDDLRREADELREILRKLKEEYNPNFNDAGVKAAVKSFEDYAARDAADTKEVIPDSEIGEILKEDNESSGVDWQAFKELQQDDTEVLYNFEAYLPPFLRSFIRQQLMALRKWLVQNGVLADKAPSDSESQAVKSAREAFEAAVKEVKSKTHDLEKQQDDLDKDYGPDDIFRALTGKCVSVDSGEYTYEHCWLSKTSQKSKKGHGNTQMGSFDRIDRVMADDDDRLDGKSLGRGERIVLRYEDGQQCWNGPRRRTDVWLACAETEELWRVSESEKCVYKMEVGTPAACGIEVVEQPHGKDEL